MHYYQLTAFPARGGAVYHQIEAYSLRSAEHFARNWLDRRFNPSDAVFWRLRDVTARTLPH